jgi:hypothetical protein
MLRAKYPHSYAKAPQRLHLPTAAVEKMRIASTALPGSIVLSFLRGVSVSGSTPPSSTRIGRFQLTNRVSLHEGILLTLPLENPTHAVTQNCSWLGEMPFWLPYHEMQDEIVPNLT